MRKVWQKIKIASLVTVLAWIVLYLVLGYILESLNPYDWTQGTREFHVIISLYALLFAVTKLKE